MDFATVALVIAALTFVVNLVLAIRSGQWAMPDRLAKMESRMMNAIVEHKESADDAIARTRKELDDRADQLRREYGETIKAISANFVTNVDLLSKRIHEFELWSRDHFVRRDSFLTVTEEFKETLQNRETRVDQQFSAINAKLDKLTDRLIPSRE